MKKFLTCLLALLMMLAMAGCSGKTNPSDNTGGDNSDGDQTEQPGDGDEDGDKDDEGSKLPVIEGWHKEPVVAGTFYDDFSEGISSEYWTADDVGWGTGNNGTRVSNIMYSTDEARVAAEGATGGVVTLRATGNYHGGVNTQMQGAVLITKDAFGAGKYETRVKVLPRAGQCTAMWTYYNGTPNATLLEDSRYSEIDIELPDVGGDFRQMSATTYEKFISKTQLNQTTSRIVFDNIGMEGFSLNDGQWHVLTFEWRTDEENGDKGIVWYVDGTPVVKYTTNVPIYAAPFNIGTHFPNQPNWIGVPNFETAYMYVDWVRITSYDDPTTDETTRSTKSFTFTDLGASEIPHTDYISNGTFLQGTATSAVAWEAERGSSIIRRTDEASYLNYLEVAPENTVYQNIEAKYKGHRVKLVVDAQILSGSGEVHVWVEGRYASLLVREQSDELVFRHTIGGSKSTTLLLEDDLTESVRVVIKTDAGTTARINSVKLFMVDENGNLL